MGRKAAWPPPVYTRHGKEYVRIRPAPGEVRDLTLGPAGSEEARQEYLRIVAELSAGGLAPLLARGALTVAMLCDVHLEWAENRYDARQLARIETALKPVLALYGRRLAAEFGPVALETVRAEYVRKGYCRRLCNQMTDCVRWMFRRAAGKELVPHATAEALYHLTALYRGEAVAGRVAPDHPRVPAVERALVEKTLAGLGRVVADMVRFQLWTGARPGEVCALRPVDLERPWKTIDGVAMWLYKLDGHKTDWRGHHRWIPIGPRAQALLAPYLERAADAYCFSPVEARKAWEESKRAARKSRVQPSQRNRSKARPKKQPGVRYTTQSYGHAIAKACARQGVPHWSPNQIRHEVLERVETEHGQEDARCVGGHTTATTTAIYTRGVLRAAAVLAKMG